MGKHAGVKSIQVRFVDCLEPLSACAFCSHEFRPARLPPPQGCRQHMEDTYMAVTNIDNDSQRAFYGVYDGHGGHRASEFVAQKLHTVRYHEPLNTTTTF